MESSGDEWEVKIDPQNIFEDIHATALGAQKQKGVWVELEVMHKQEGNR